MSFSAFLLICREYLVSCLACILLGLGERNGDLMALYTWDRNTTLYRVKNTVNDRIREAIIRFSLKPRPLKMEGEQTLIMISYIQACGYKDPSGTRCSVFSVFGSATITPPSFSLPLAAATCECRGPTVCHALGRLPEGEMVLGLFCLQKSKMHPSPFNLELHPEQKPLPQTIISQIIWLGQQTGAH